MADPGFVEGEWAKVQGSGGSLEGSNGWHGARFVPRKLPCLRGGGVLTYLKHFFMLFYSYT